MVALFCATHSKGVTHYVSCRTGIEYIISPEENGVSVESTGANLKIITAKRKDALRLIETADLARLAN
jgi:hypothetical protein